MFQMHPLLFLVTLTILFMAMPTTSSPFLVSPPGSQGDGQGLLQQQADKPAEGDYQTFYSEGED